MCVLLVISEKTMFSVIRSNVLLWFYICFIHITDSSLHIYSSFEADNSETDSHVKNDLVQLRNEPSKPVSIYEDSVTCSKSGMFTCTRKLLPTLKKEFNGGQTNTVLLPVSEMDYKQSPYALYVQAKTERSDGLEKSRNLSSVSRFLSNFAFTISLFPWLNIRVSGDTSGSPMFNFSLETKSPTGSRGDIKLKLKEMGSCPLIIKQKLSA